MKYNLDKPIENEIIEIAKLCGINKIILFGSRARCDNGERSDIDLAVAGGNTLDFYYQVEEKTHTLLMFDIVDLDKEISEELKNEIEKDGVLIYEKVR